MEDAEWHVRVRCTIAEKLANGTVAIRSMQVQKGEATVCCAGNSNHSHRTMLQMLKRSLPAVAHPLVEIRKVLANAEDDDVCLPRRLAGEAERHVTRPDEACVHRDRDVRVE